MKIEIRKYLEYVLSHQGELSLEGIGRFKRNFHSAKLSVDKRKISPPKFELDFTDESEEDHNLVHLISTRESISSKDASAVVKAFTQSVLNKLLNYENVHIPGLGILSKQNGDFTFSDTHDGITNHLKGLKTIDINPVPRKVVTPVIQSVEKPIQKDENQWINYLLSLLLGSLMILAYNHLVVATPISKNIKQESSTKLNAPKADNQELSEELISPVENSIPDDSIRGSDAENKSLEEKDVSAKQTIQPQDSQINRKNDYGLAPDQQCIIMVGVFSKTYNALAMVDRIRAAGYQPFRDVKYEVHRVGIQFNCNDRNIVQTVKEVRKQFGSKAYLYQPKLSLDLD